MYEHILAEMEARGMLKEAKESNQNPWRDAVLGTAGAGAGLGTGALVGAELGARKHKKDVEQAGRLVEHAKQRLTQARAAQIKNQRAHRAGRPFATNRYAKQVRHHLKGYNRASVEARKRLVPALRSAAKGGGKGALIGTAGGLALGVGTSRYMGREKKASSIEEIEQMLVFAAFEDELEKLSMGVGKQVAKVLPPGVADFRKSLGMDPANMLKARKAKLISRARRAPVRRPAQPTPVVD